MIEFVPMRDRSQTPPLEPKEVDLPTHQVNALLFQGVFNPDQPYQWLVLRELAPALYYEIVKDCVRRDLKREDAAYILEPSGGSESCFEPHEGGSSNLEGGIYYVWAYHPWALQSTSSVVREVESGEQTPLRVRIPILPKDWMQFGGRDLWSGDAKSSS